jgi:hypothetical protein
MEEAEAHHRLFAPGTLLYLKRWQETPGGWTAATAGPCGQGGLKPSRLGPQTV